MRHEKQGILFQETEFTDAEEVQDGANAAR